MSFPYTIPVFNEDDRVCLSVARLWLPFAALNNNYLDNATLWATKTDLHTARQEIYRQDIEMMSDGSGPCYHIAAGTIPGETKTITWDGTKWVLP